MRHLRRGFGEFKREHTGFIIGAAFGGIESSHDAELALIASYRQAFDFCGCLEREDIFIEIDTNFIGIEPWHIDVENVILFGFYNIDSGLNHSRFGLNRRIGFMFFFVDGNIIAMTNF